MTTDVAFAIAARMELSAVRLPEARKRTAIRQAAGLTRSQLAEVLGVTRQCVYNWESGRRHPRGEHLQQYHQALDAMRRQGLRQ